MLSFVCSQGRHLPREVRDGRCAFAKEGLQQAEDKAGKRVLTAQAPLRDRRMQDLG